MQPTSVSLLPTYINPNSSPLYSLQFPIPSKATHYRTRTILQCSYREKRDTHYKGRLQTTNNSTQNVSDDKSVVLGTMYSFLRKFNNKGRGNQGQEASEEEDSKNKTHRGLSSNMLWRSMKATVSQRFNLEGTVSSVVVVLRDRHLALPHVTVPDIRRVDWAELKSRGFRGVVFDKDNTLTCPYSLALWPPLVSSLDQCKSVFGPNVVVFSNSAGLYQYDADASKAGDLEKTIGIHVIRHGVKKPAGTAEDIEKYFGCAPSVLVMVGDRYFTDIVYGNRNGFLTILTEPFSLAQEPFIVKQVRKLEASLVNYWYKKGLKPASHSLLSEAKHCVKVPYLFRPTHSQISSGRHSKLRRVLQSLGSQNADQQEPLQAKSSVKQTGISIIKIGQKYFQFGRIYLLTYMPTSIEMVREDDTSSPRTLERT